MLLQLRRFGGSWSTGIIAPEKINPTQSGIHAILTRMGMGAGPVRSLRRIHLPRTQSNITAAVVLCHTTRSTVRLVRSLKLRLDGKYIILILDFNHTVDFCRIAHQFHSAGICHSHGRIAIFGKVVEEDVRDCQATGTQGQGIAQKNEAWGRFRELVCQILHFRVDFAIFGSDLLCLGIDDVCQTDCQLLPFVKVRILKMGSSVPCVGK